MHTISCDAHNYSIEPLDNFHRCKGGRTRKIQCAANDASTNRFLQHRLMLLSINQFDIRLWIRFVAQKYSPLPRNIAYRVAVGPARGPSDYLLPSPPSCCLLSIQYQHGLKSRTEQSTNVLHAAKRIADLPTIDQINSMVVWLVTMPMRVPVPVPARPGHLFGHCRRSNAAYM